MKKNSPMAMRIEKLISRLKFPEYGTYYERVLTFLEGDILVVKALEPVYF